MALTSPDSVTPDGSPSTTRVATPSVTVLMPPVGPKQIFPSSGCSTHGSLPPSPALQRRRWCRRRRRRPRVASQGHHDFGDRRAWAAAGAAMAVSAAIEPTTSDAGHSDEVTVVGHLLVPAGRFRHWLGTVWATRLDDRTSAPPVGRRKCTRTPTAKQLMDLVLVTSGPCDADAGWAGRVARSLRPRASPFGGRTRSVFPSQYAACAAFRHPVRR